MTILLLTFTLNSIRDTQAPVGSLSKQRVSKAAMTLKETTAGSLEVPTSWNQDCWEKYQ